MKVKSAIIISTYNWPEALELVLKSLIGQTVMPDEVLIADDGSTEDTALVINEFSQKIAAPLYHITQEDKGFRKAKILNKAIAATSADYIIEVDGDCIMHPNFIQDHLSRMEKGVFSYGSRVNIQKAHLLTLFKEKQVFFNFFSKGIKKRTRALRIPFLSLLFKKSSVLPKKLRGCNISFWKEDIIKVNGYNEDMEGWGREDSELFVRVLNSGCMGRRLRYKGIVYHIWHQEKPKNKLEENDKMQQAAIVKNKTWCENGVNQYFR